MAEPSAHRCPRCGTINVGPPVNCLRCQAPLATGMQAHPTAPPSRSPGQAIALPAPPLPKLRRATNRAVSSREEARHG